MIDLVASVSYVLSMPNLVEVVEALKERLARDARYLQHARSELDSLREIINRIADLSEGIDQARIRIIRTVRIIGDKQAKKILEAELRSEDERNDLLRWGKYKSDRNVSLRSCTAEYLRVVRKARVGDIVQFLRAIGFDYAKRQTVEAMVKRNPDFFTALRHGREKFVKLASTEI